MAPRSAVFMRGCGTSVRARRAAGIAGHRRRLATTAAARRGSDIVSSWAAAGFITRPAIVRVAEIVEDALVGLRGKAQVGAVAVAVAHVVGVVDVPGVRQAAKDVAVDVLSAVLKFASVWGRGGDSRWWLVGGGRESAVRAVDSRRRGVVVASLCEGRWAVAEYAA